MCDIDYDGEECQVWQETVIKKARKEHKCNACRGVINPGDSYLKHFSVYDGYVTSNKACKDCHELSTEFLNDHGVTYPPYALRSNIQECFWEEKRHGSPEIAAKWEKALHEMDERRVEG